MVAIAPHSDRKPNGDAASRLERLAAIAGEIGLDEVGAEASRFARRVAEGRFHVACIGQFKRGKSSLLDVLAGGAGLPTGVAPVTSALTVVRYGSDRRAIVHLDTGESRVISPGDLTAWVTEAGNPGNLKGVVATELFSPSPLLASGMCLVDTPGIGTVSSENDRTTQAFVPHVDAALVVLGADPPISADELSLVERIARQTPALIFVMSKADRTSGSERREAREFCRTVIEARLGRPVGDILEVSAVERRTGTGPARDWPVLVQRLTALAERAGTHLVDAAAERGLRVVGTRVLGEIAEREAALTRPVAESEARAEALKRSADDAERSLDDLSPLLTAEQGRLRRCFVARQGAFVARVVPATRAELAGMVRAAAAGSRSARWTAAHAAAQAVFQRVLETWHAEEQPVADAAYRGAMQRFVDLANALLARLAAEGRLPAAELPPALEAERGLRTRSRLRLTELLAVTARSPIRWLADALRPPRSFAAALERHALAYLEHLIVTNAARVTNALDAQVLESRHRLEHDLRDRIRDAHRVALRALERARNQQRLGAATVREEMGRLAAARDVVTGLLPPPDAR
jgi:hypothetical protein